MHGTTNDPENGNGSDAKAFWDLISRLFDHPMREILLKRKVIGRTQEFCTYGGIYFYEKDSSQTTRLQPGDSFPPVHILPPKGQSGAGRVGHGIWVLRSEHSPHKTWRENRNAALRALFVAIIISAAIYLIRLGFQAPLPTLFH